MTAGDALERSANESPQLSPTVLGELQDHDDTSPHKRGKRKKRLAYDDYELGLEFELTDIS